MIETPRKSLLGCNKLNCWEIGGLAPINISSNTELIHSNLLEVPRLPAAMDSVFAPFNNGYYYFVGGKGDDDKRVGKIWSINS